MIRMLHGVAYRRSQNPSPSHLVKPLFDQTSRFNAFSDNRSLLERIHRSHLSWALDIFKKHARLGFPENVDEASITLTLKASDDDLGLCCQIHGFAIASGFVSFTVVFNYLMNAYCKGGNFERALCIFEKLDVRDTVSWNTLLSGFQTSDDAFRFALQMNLSGVVFDAVTYNPLLAFCVDCEEFLFGLQLHCLAVKCALVVEVFVGNVLIILYSRQGMLVDSTEVFEEMPSRDLVSWNAMLSGFTKKGIYGLESIGLFVEMLREGVKLDHVSFASAVVTCGQERNFELRRQIHGMTIEVGYAEHVPLGNVLVST